MEQLTKNQAVATSQEAVQNQNEPQLRDENAHNDKSVHGVLNPTYQAGLRRESPMLGFHKQMDNRIKLLEEILSFRMQGVEFDNGDMYVDGHKAASDVRDEFVSVTEK